MDHLVGTSVLVGAYALDAMAAAQDRREQLQRTKKQWEKNACTKSGNIGGRTNYSQSNVATITKHQAYTMLGLGRQIVFMLKLLTASVMVLCVLCVMLIVKK